MTEAEREEFERAIAAEDEANAMDLTAEEEAEFEALLRAYDAMMARLAWHVPRRRRRRARGLMHLDLFALLDRGVG
jgi:phosphoenolpyruvate carboxylase